MSIIPPIVVLIFWCLLVSSSPLSSKDERVEERAELPVIDLPYGSYRAASYNQASDIYIFKNIRYAAPPVGERRWAKPEPPLNESRVQDGSVGHSCIQAAPNGLNLLGAGNGSPVGGAINQFLGGMPIPLFSGGNEDCLFLDVYVPGKAVRDSSLKLPVVVFIYGGAYVFGSKDSLQPQLPFYDGTGMIGNSKNNMIFVTMNYRVGAYGFLAGTTMEKDATPNAGLWDQRAAFQWVRDHIHLFGGDASKVTAMGQSAGAGSIMHHLVGEGGKLDPLFSKAILLSPAFEYMWDRAGTVQQTFENFASLAGCAGKGVACLRAADAASLMKANTQLMKQQYSGTFAVGPTPDGAFIRQLPVLELSTGNFWDVESLIISHTSAESNVFVSGLVQTNEQFAEFVRAIFPNYTQVAGITDKITSFYPAVGSKGSKYKSQTDRVQALLRDSSFTCNARHLTEALGDNKVWNMKYSVSPGWHGTDLIPTFFNTQSPPDALLGDLASLAAPLLGSLIAGLSAAVLSYFTSYVLTGDPNTSRKVVNLPPTVRWDHPDSKGEEMAGVVDIGNLGFGTVRDDQNGKTACDFWRDVAAAVTALGGYAPPGAVVQQRLVGVQGDASAKYRGGDGG